MRALLTLSVVAALALGASALGGENYLGTVRANDGGTGSTAAWNFIALDSGFFVPPSSKISVQPDGGAYVCLDTHATNAGTVTCNGTNGVLVPGGALFQTSCGQMTVRPYVTENVLLGDGGISATSTRMSIQTCTVACVPASGTTVSCAVFSRSGTEN